MGGNDRILYALGLPIAEGALSTILGVFGLAFAPSYIFITFFKMIFLVIALGALHGVVLLPVLLSLFGPGSCTNNKQPKMVSVYTSQPRNGGDRVQRTSTHFRAFLTPPPPCPLFIHSDLNPLKKDILLDYHVQWFFWEEEEENFG